MARRRKRPGGGSRKSPGPPAAAGADSPAAKRHAASAAPRRRLDTVLLILAGSGIALTAYLTVSAWFGAHPAYCGADSGCDLVQSSRWSVFLGMPMSLWGLATYALLARALWRLRTRPSAWRMALTLALLGVAVSWFLTLVSLREVDATCAYCLASLGILNTILALLVVRRPAHVPQHRWSRALPLPVGLAVATVLGLQLHFSGLFDPAAGPEDPWLKGLAIHLHDSGARFYGAWWCPRCVEQKQLFASSAKRLPYVECSPQARNGPVSLACLDNDIRDYPTWVINGRKHGGLLAPRQLAREAHFPER